MMRGSITKMAISLEPGVDHTHVMSIKNPDFSLLNNMAKMSTRLE